MPKKNKARKNTKNKESQQIEKKILYPDVDGQIYGFLEKALGSRFFDVNCMDGKKRRCKVRNKRMRVQQGDCCIISLREYDDKNADIIHKYNTIEVRQLQKEGELPSISNIEELNDNEGEDDITFAFDFDDI